MILYQTKDYVVLSKPHHVVCHNSPFHNQLQKSQILIDRNGVVVTPPMLQHVRDATGHKVNIIHRLDKVASGCLLLAFCKGDDEKYDTNNKNSEENNPVPQLSNDNTH